MNLSRATPFASPENANFRRAGAVAVVLLGLLLAWCVLSVVGVRQLGSWPAAAVPFVLNRVLIVQLLGTLPLSLWVGRRLALLLGDRPPVLFGVGALGLLLAAGTFWVADTPGRVEFPDTSVSHLVRLAWCGLLLLPWCTVCASLWCPGGVGPGERRPSARGHRGRSQPAWLTAADGVIAALLAVLPVLYVQQLVERQSALVADAIINQQYARAWQLSRQLALLGGGTVPGQPPHRAVADTLGSRLRQLSQRVAQPLPSGAEIEAKLVRASDLYSLGRLDEVTQLLTDLADDPRAQLRLALTDEARRDYAAAAAGYQRTIERLSSRRPLGPDDLRLLRAAYERRVNNLRRTGHYRQAETELLEGVEQWPEARDALWMQLGFHYQMAGRTSEAIAFFQQAAAANPSRREQAEAALAQLDRQAEGCLLRPARGATR